MHFEPTQFEQNRVDGWKKLKPNAVPTIFDVPNPPALIGKTPRKSIYKVSNNVHTYCYFLFLFLQL